MKKFKVTNNQVNEMLSLYASKGWRVSHLARRYHIDRSTVYYYIRTFAVKRKRHVLHPGVIPEEIRGTYKRKHKRVVPLVTDELQIDEYVSPKRGAIYDRYLQHEEMRRLKKQLECEHRRWIKRCSQCGCILESDAGLNRRLTIASVDI